MKIKISEFKVRALLGVENLIDVYFSGNSISDKLINATVKIIANQNIDKLDSVIDLFADKSGYIDTDLIIIKSSLPFLQSFIIL